MTASSSPLRACVQVHLLRSTRPPGVVPAQQQESQLPSQVPAEEDADEGNNAAAAAAAATVPARPRFSALPPDQRPETKVHYFSRQGKDWSERDAPFNPVIEQAVKVMPGLER